MKEIYELDVYKLSETLSDMIWYAFYKWPEKARKTIGYQIIRSFLLILLKLMDVILLLIKQIFIVTQGTHLKRQKHGRVDSFAGGLCQMKKYLSIQKSLRNLVQNSMLLSEALNKFSLPNYQLSSFKFCEERWKTG
jgi:hypothetical protein